jgi:hypothetical protein
MHNMAVVYTRLKRLQEAKDLHKNTLEMRRRVLGVEHPDVLCSMGALASTLNDLGHVEQAVPNALRTGTGNQTEAKSG